MTRSREVPGLFAADPAEAVVLLLQQQQVALDCAQIKALLTAVGVPKSAVDSGWTKAQRKLAKRPDVIVKAKTYQWTEAVLPAPAARPTPAARRAPASPPTPLEALDLLLKGRLTAPKKSALGEVVRAALQAGASSPVPAALEGGAPAPTQQAVNNAVIALAELAMDVEKLTANEVSAEALIHRVRAHMARHDLEPVDRAGTETTFDRKRHRPIGGSIDDGAAVLVVRPGYTWKRPEGDLLIDKAIVEE